MDYYVWSYGLDQFPEGRGIGYVTCHVVGAGHRIGRIAAMDKSCDAPASGGEAARDMPAYEPARAGHEDMSGRGRHAFMPFITSVIMSIASSSCASVCDAMKLVRSSASPSGVAGGRTGFTYTPRSYISFTATKVASVV